jgi:hypothetical protein
MEDLEYIFALWGVGIAVSLTGFIGEWIVYRNKEKIRKSIVGRIIKKLTWHGRVRERERAMMRRWRARVEIEPFEMIQC